MSIFSDMKFAQDEDEYNSLKTQANMEDNDYGYDEFYCEQCGNYNKCKKDENERCETWYEEGRD